MIRHRGMGSRQRERVEIRMVCPRSHEWTVEGVRKLGSVSVADSYCPDCGEPGLATW